MIEFKFTRTWKLPSGTCTTLAPDGDHMYSRPPPATAASVSPPGDQATAFTALTWHRTAANSALRRSQIQTQCGMLSFTVASSCPSGLHASVPTRACVFGVCVWGGGTLLGQRCAGPGHTALQLPCLQQDKMLVIQSK